MAANMWCILLGPKLAECSQIPKKRIRPAFWVFAIPIFFSFRKLPNLLNCQFVKRCMMFSLCIVLVIASLYGTASLDKNSSKFHSIANR